MTTKTYLFAVTRIEAQWDRSATDSNQRARAPSGTDIVAASELVCTTAKVIREWVKGRTKAGAHIEILHK